MNLKSVIFKLLSKVHVTIKIERMENCHLTQSRIDGSIQAIERNIIADCTIDGNVLNRGELNLNNVMFQGAERAIQTAVDTVGGGTIAIEGRGIAFDGNRVYGISGSSGVSSSPRIYRHQCFICERPIDSEEAISDSELLKKYTGQESEVLCCNCFRVAKVIIDGKEVKREDAET